MTSSRIRRGSQLGVPTRARAIADGFASLSSVADFFAPSVSRGLLLRPLASRRNTPSHVHARYPALAATWPREAMTLKTGNLVIQREALERASLFEGRFRVLDLLGRSERGDTYVVDCP